MTDIIDVPSLTSFGTFCSRSLQAENVVVMGSASARKSRIFMGGLDGSSTSSTNVYTVLESKPTTQTSQTSQFVIKLNQGSDNLNVTHETFAVDAKGNLCVYDDAHETLLQISANAKLLECTNVSVTGQLCVQSVDLLEELNAAKQDIEDLKATVASLQAILQSMGA